jgi:hypothetical protein
VTFYTYVHRRETDDAIFYVGKGQKNRAQSPHGRNKHWKNTVAKHGLKVEIAAEWVTEVEAFEHEKRLISQYRADGQPLVNKTDGGEGAAGRVYTKEELAALKVRVKQQWSEKRDAMIMAINAPEAKAAKSARSKAHNARPEVRAALSVSSKAYNARPEVKAAQSIRSGEYANRPEVKARVSAWAKEKNKARYVAIMCSNGLSFDSIAGARTWLYTIGHTKAATSALSLAARGVRKSAYGFTWRFAATNNSFKEA